MAEDGKLNANDTLSKVLAYVDSPFKLFALVLMAVLAFTGYFLWQHQELIVGAVKEQRRLPEIADERVEDAAGHLFRMTGATVVAVFKVNPMFGTRVVHRAYTKDGRDKTNDGLDVGLFTTNTSNNEDVVRLMANEIPCGPYTAAQSEMGLWYIAKGVTFMCRVSVPPDPGRFVGQITVGWEKEPRSLEEARTMLTIASTMLARSKS